MFVLQRNIFSRYAWHGHPVSGLCPRLEFAGSDLQIFDQRFSRMRVGGLNGVYPTRREPEVVTRQETRVAVVLAVLVDLIRSDRIMQMHNPVPILLQP